MIIISELRTNGSKSSFRLADLVPSKLGDIRKKMYSLLIIQDGVSCTFSVLVWHFLNYYFSLSFTLVNVSKLTTIVKFR